MARARVRPALTMPLWVGGEEHLGYMSPIWGLSTRPIGLRLLILLSCGERNPSSREGFVKSQVPGVIARSTISDGQDNEDPAHRPRPCDRPQFSIQAPSQASFITASASISTSHRGSMKPVTTIIALAGRTSANTSP